MHVLTVGVSDIKMEPWYFRLKQVTLPLLVMQGLNSPYLSVTIGLEDNRSYLGRGWGPLPGAQS